MRKLIKFDDGTIAVVYKNSDIRAQLTDKQVHDLMMTRNIVPIKETGEQIWIQL